MTEIGTYKGKPVFIIKRIDNDRFPFVFGIAKAKLIMENFPAIEDFIKRNTLTEDLNQQN